jgi:MFS family permease
VLAILVYANVIEIWHILTLSFITGCAQAFGGPAYQSLIPLLVSKNDVPNAIALNSIQFNLARVIGPLLAGVVLSTFATLGYSERIAMASCFAINSLSFLVVILALQSLHIKHVAPTQSAPILTELKSGVSYVRHEPGIMALVALAAATTFLGFPVMTLLPVFAQQVFQEGVGEYSRMMAFQGAGAVIGALAAAWMGRYRHMGLGMLVAQIIFGTAVIAFAMSRTLWVSYLLLFVCGAMLIVVFSTVTSLVQLVVPNEMRGRVSGIYLVAFRGGMPLGALASGYAASLAPAPAVLTANGILLVAVACYFLLKSHGVREL